MVMSAGHRLSPRPDLPTHHGATGRTVVLYAAYTHASEHCDTCKVNAMIPMSLVLAPQTVGVQCSIQLLGVML